MRLCVFVLCLAASAATEISKRYPEIHHTTPLSGVMNGGTYVMVRGNNLGAVTHCRFGLTVMPVIRAPGHSSPTSVTCISPAQDPGTYEIQLSEDNGQSWTPLPSFRKNKPATYTFYNIPRLLEITPTHGPAYGHTKVRVAISGWEDSKDHDKAQVMFGDKTADVETAECEGDTCWLLVAAPQICFFANENGCDKMVPIRVSLNGQDFTLDPEKHLSFRYDPEWSYTSLIEEDSFVIPDLI